MNLSRALSPLLALLIACAAGGYAQVPAADGTYPIIPRPVSLVAGNGSFIMDPQTPVVYDPSLLTEASYLCELFGAAAKPVERGRGAAVPDGGIVLQLDSSIQHPEGYSLVVDTAAITVSAKTPAGVFYGIQSLRQLLPAAVEDSTDMTEVYRVPAVRIADAPRYAYRGMHLDVARHFFPVADVKRYLDLLAMHKLNRFHWHLTDDQGWRIEIKAYPRLTTVGGYRAGTAIGLAGTRNAPYTYDNVRYGGFYTQDQIREVVAYAAERHITVLPEIELPGHASAALAAYPQFGNTGGPYEVARHWGIFPATFAPTEATFGFLEDVLTEVLALFPGEYIHIGGDEVLKGEWAHSDSAQAVMRREGLADEEALQSYFVQRIGRFLAARGRRMIGWDEILEGGLAPDATVMSWRGEAGGIAAARQGHDVIMTPGEYCYFDYYQVDSAGRAAEPVSGSTRSTTVERVYSYAPTPAELSGAAAAHVLGVQGNVWTEYMPTFARVEYQVLPRMTALAEVVWSAAPAEQRDWGDFQRRLGRLAGRWDVLGYTYARYALAGEE